MATDPTQKIRKFVLASPFELSGDALLDRVAGLPPSTDVPYLTVSVDWQVEGTHPGRGELVKVKRS